MLKKYHPMGTVVNRRGERIKMLLSSHENLGGKSKNSVLTNPGEIIVVDWSEFCDLVSKDQVQLFIMGEHGPRIQYTEQELGVVPRRVRKQMERDNTDESLYWNGELTLWDDCFTVTDGLSISVVSCRIARGIRSVLYIGGLWINDPTPEFIMKLDATTISLQRKGRQLFLASWLQPELNRLLREYEGPVSINTSSMMHLDNQVYGLKMMGFVAPSEDNVRALEEDLSNCATSNPHNNGRFWGFGKGNGGVSVVNPIKLE